MKNISILVPCYNEEKSLPLFYPEVKKVIELKVPIEYEDVLLDEE